MGTTIEDTKFVGMEFNDPDVDVQKIAQGLGARTDKIENQGAISDALARAFAHSGPNRSRAVMTLPKRVAQRGWAASFWRCRPTRRWTGLATAGFARLRGPVISGVGGPVTCHSG